MKISTALNIAREISKFSKHEKAGFDILAFLSKLNKKSRNILLKNCDNDKALEIASQANDESVKTQLEDVLIMDKIEELSIELKEVEEYERKIYKKKKERKQNSEKNKSAKEEKTITPFDYIHSIIHELSKVGSFSLRELDLIDAVYQNNLERIDKKLDVIYSNMSSMEESDRFSFDYLLKEKDLEDHEDLDYLIARSKAKAEDNKNE